MTSRLNPQQFPELLSCAEVACAFNVDPKTVTRWAKAGRIPADQIVVTLGGQRRYRGDWVRARVGGRP
jgi:predicted site-specific integrase-resolvase